MLLYNKTDYLIAMKHYKKNDHFLPRNWYEMAQINQVLSSILVAKQAYIMYLILLATVWNSSLIINVFVMNYKTVMLKGG